MQARATAKIRIQATNEVVRTLKQHTKALQFCVNTAWDNKTKNNVELHHIVYTKLRTVYRLPAQIAVSCVKQAAGIVKRAKNKPIIKRSSVRYNFPRSASLKGNTLTLRTLNRRERFQLSIPQHFAKYFERDVWGVKESLLRTDRKGRAFFLFTFSREVEAEGSCLQTRVLGIDLGINNLAVTSDKAFFKSPAVKRMKRKYRYLRAKLQAKGTRPARKLLRKLSGRETRYMAWVNHNVSKSIVDSFDGNRIVMEDLKGIRKRKRGRMMNWWISNWSFFQLQSFIQYKAERRGIEVLRANPAYTSKICHRCGSIGTRIKGCFSCHCGLTSYSADLNAALNLAHPMLDERQVAVTRPHSTWNDSKAVFNGIADDHSAKSS